MRLITLLISVMLIALGLYYWIFKLSPFAPQTPSESISPLLPADSTNTIEGVNQQTDKMQQQVDTYNQSVQKYQDQIDSQLNQ